MAVSHDAHSIDILSARVLKLRCWNVYCDSDLINIPLVISHPFRYPIGGVGVKVRREQLACGLGFCITVDRSISQTISRVAYDVRHEIPSPGHHYTGFSRVELIENFKVFANASQFVNGRVAVLNTCYDKLVNAFLKLS